MAEIRQGSCAKITTPKGETATVEADWQGGGGTGTPTTVVSDGLVGKVIGKTTKGMYYFMVFHDDTKQRFPAAKVLASWCEYAKRGCARFSGTKTDSKWKRWE